MNLAEYDALRQRILGLADAIQNAKRPDYTVENIDVLHNFKSVGERLGLSPLAVGRVYALKHEDAITRMQLYPDAAFSEPPAARVADRINYAILEFALLQELVLGDKVWPANDVSSP